MTYSIIKTHVEALLSELSKASYKWTTHAEAKELYAKNRDRFNVLKLMTFNENLQCLRQKYNESRQADHLTVESLYVEAIAKKKSGIGKEVIKYLSRSTPKTLFESLSIDEQVELSALFIFLNKVGYNGMYRENSLGLFNIPVGRSSSKPTIFSSDHLRALSNAFQNVTFTCCDYRTTLENAKEGDFVYLDPPYAGDTMFTTYTKTTFGNDEQMNLHEEICKLTAKGCKVMLSNSATEMILNMYQGNDSNFTVDIIELKRSIGASKESRKNTVQEVIVRNYSE